jgi:hypothetical protein
MSARLCTHAEVKQVVQVVGVLCNRLDVKLNLAVKLRNESAVNGKLSRLSEETFINQNLERISLEQIEEILSSLSCHYFLLSIDFLALGSSLLKVSAFLLFHSAFTSSFHPLSLHQLSLLDTKEEFFVLI